MSRNPGPASRCSRAPRGYCPVLLAIEPDITPAMIALLGVLLVMIGFVAGQLRTIVRSPDTGIAAEPAGPLAAPSGSTGAALD